MLGRTEYRCNSWEVKNSDLAANIRSLDLGSNFDYTYLQERHNGR